MPAIPVNHFYPMKSSLFTSLPPVSKTGLDWGARVEVVPLAEFPRAVPSGPTRKFSAGLVTKKKSRDAIQGRRFYVLIMRRKWRKSFAG